MRPQSIAVLTLALVCGISAAIGLRTYLQTPAALGDQVDIVVPAVDIPRNSVINASLLHTKKFPRDVVPEGAFNSIEAVVERSTLTALARNEPILNVRLSPKGQRGLAALIPKGMRGYTIITPSIAAGVAGLIFPGNRVDVLLTVTNMTYTSADGNQGDPTGGGSTTTLLQNVELLAVDQTVEAPADSNANIATKGADLKSVTLLVSPEQAQKLKLGESKGTLHLSLRNPEDSEEVEPHPTILSELRFAREKANTPDQELEAAKVKTANLTKVIAEAPKPLRRVINTIRGGSNSGRQEVVSYPNQSELDLKTASQNSLD